jgi:hypothetical protein
MTAVGLVRPGDAPYVSAMRAALPLLSFAPFTIALLMASLLVFATPVAAQGTAKHKAAKPAGATAIGTFDDWTAATSKEAGQTVCYAFTRAHASTPALAGRGDVVLTVTERQTGRDAVALSAGFAYSANAAVTLVADSATFEFYTAQRSAFARDGHATVQAFQKARSAVARSPGPKGGEVSDTFSLKGFSAAYAAIVKHCPPGKPAS